MSTHGPSHVSKEINYSQCGFIEWEQSESYINIFIFSLSLSFLLSTYSFNEGGKNKRAKEIFRSRADIGAREKSIGKFAQSDGTTREVKHLVV